MARHHRGALPGNDEEFQFLLAAGLISRHEKMAAEEVYDKAVKCFEALIDVREYDDAAGRVASLINKTVVSVQDSAEAIIARLLFNHKNDPYISLGLPRYAENSEIVRRWKRLIVLYHPDRHPELSAYEEKAKKINEVYEEIRRNGENVFSSRPVNGVGEINLPRTDTVHYTRYLKYIPTFILALAIVIAVISLLLLMNAKKGNGQPPQKGGAGTHRTKVSLFYSPFENYNGLSPFLAEEKEPIS